MIRSRALLTILLATTVAGCDSILDVDPVNEIASMPSSAQAIVSSDIASAALPGMMERGFGRIVNITSVSGQAGQMGQANYSAAKAGDIGFTKALAQEAARAGITVNAICPGYINTEMVQAVPRSAFGEVKEIRPAAMLVWVPLADQPAWFDRVWARVREEVGRYGTRLGTQDALRRTGGVITSAGLILAGAGSGVGLLWLGPGLDAHGLWGISGGGAVVIGVFLLIAAFGYRHDSRAAAHR